MLQNGLKMLNTYLEKIQSSDESIFPMDSPHTRKKIHRKVMYGEESDRTMSEGQRLMIDFDGVIHQYTEWNDGKLNGPIEGAKEAIDILKQKYKIIIFTTRASKTENGPEVTEKLIKDVEDFLNTHEIHFDLITADKMGAMAYIDDKGIRFEGDWNNILNKIQDIEISP